MDEGEDALSVSKHSTLDGWELCLATDTNTVGIPPHVSEALPIPATVPGTVHTDLLAAGLIPDPLLDSNELAVAWIGEADWVYRTVLPATSSGVQILEFDGIDTVCDVFVDGELVGHTENMHRRFSFDVSRGSSCERVLELRFASALKYAEQQRSLYGPLPASYPAPYNFIRKMACNFGWDWGPTLVTAGVWRDMRVITGRGSRIKNVVPRTEVIGGSGTVRVRVELSDVMDCTAEVTVVVGERTAKVSVDPGREAAEIELSVDAVRLWWPVGLGPQSLYDVDVIVTQGDCVTDEWHGAVGFRSVNLSTETDSEGAEFRFIINHVGVPIRGANWIPDDCFPHRTTLAKLTHRLKQARDAGVNLLRVWGGGVYESDEFYAMCDELGILVWQDFLFACAAYPESASFREEIEAEARDNVRRLSHHPSLILWNGNNENIWGWFDWGWREKLNDAPWGLKYYLEILPLVVSEEGGQQQPYWQGTPFSGTMDVHPNDESRGTVHIWDVWNDTDYSGYAEWKPRFVSEFGWQSPANLVTLSESIHDQPIASGSLGMLHHQKATDGMGKLERGLAAHFDVPSDFAAWHYAMQLNQARALTFGIEHFRALRPRCNGTIVWQLNDCWPANSWSVIDSAGRTKLGWFALRRAYAGRLATFQRRESDSLLSLRLINDMGVSWRDSVSIARVDFVSGRVLDKYETRFTVDALGVDEIVVPEHVALPLDSSREALIADVSTAERTWHFYDLDPLLNYERCDVEIESTWVGGGNVQVILTARKFVRDLCVATDCIGPACVASDSLLTLLPGECAVLDLAGVPDSWEDATERKLVLRSANDLVAPRDGAA